MSQFNTAQFNLVMDYWTCFSRASYYSWSARKKFMPGMNDPITGLPLSSMSLRTNPAFRQSGQVAYAAMARHWFAICKQLRKEKTS